MFKKFSGRINIVLGVVINTKLSSVKSIHGDVSTQ